MKLTKRERRLVREIPIREARVKCCGEYHTIQVLGNGRLRLPNHSGEDLESIETIQELSNRADSGSFRCLEVLRWWQLLFQDGRSAPLARFRNSAIYDEALAVKSRSSGEVYRKEETPAALIEQLPKPLRSWAKDEWETRGARAQAVQSRKVPRRPVHFSRMGRWEKDVALRDARSRSYLRFGVPKEHLEPNWTLSEFFKTTPFRPPLFINGDIAVPWRMQPVSEIRGTRIVRVHLRVFRPGASEGSAVRLPDITVGLANDSLFSWEEIEVFLQDSVRNTPPLNTRKPTTGE